MLSIVRVLYSILLYLLSPLIVFLVFKPKSGYPKVGKRWKEYFGFVAWQEKKHPDVWIHAVSVGEAIAAKPLIRVMLTREPSLKILVTTTTTTGATQFDEFKDQLVHKFAPLDFPFSVRRFIRSVKPKQLIIMETELWPNLLHVCGKEGIPVAVVNARLSEKSYLSYRKYHLIFRVLSGNLAAVLCQYPGDAKRFIALGLPDSKVHITGSIKYDLTLSESIFSDAAEFRNSMGSRRFLWIAASTHEGEDEIVLDVHKRLLQKYPDSLLILVPRHPHRFNAVYDLSTKDFVTARRTTMNSSLQQCQVYLADTVGEMLLLMGASDVCFMGGSMLGEKVGGHNYLEPAALKLPILSGPSYFNFQIIAEQLIEADALRICKDGDSIYSSLAHLAECEKARNEMGRCGAHIVERNRGALERTLHLLSIAPH